MKQLTPSERLAQFIRQSRQDLEQYAAKPNASETVIAIKNRQLAELSAIYESLSVNIFPCEAYWIRAEAFIQRAQEEPGVSAIIFTLQLRETGTPAFLNLNLL